MPQFPPGPLFGSSRFQLERGRADGFCWVNDCRINLPALPTGPDDLHLTAEVRSINYRGTYDASVGESFAQFVTRRREEFRRERDLLAGYHQTTAHVPQVMDWVAGRNEWDADVQSHGLADGEPALVLRRLRAEPLNEIREPVSVEEALALGERLIMLLRVFHNTAPKVGPPHYFRTLQPDDILFDRNTRDCWFQNLWKLRPKSEFRTAGAVPCHPQQRWFVSPALWGGLLPRPLSGPPPGGKPGADNLDLYGVGAILLYLLTIPDLSGPHAGASAAEALAGLKRGIPAAVVDFLRRLLGHQFLTAQDALNELAGVRGTRPAPGYMASPKPQVPDKPFQGGTYADGSEVAGRYRVAQRVFQGGRGCVYLGEDQRTGSQVILKVNRYQENEDLRALAAGGPGAILTRRREMLGEAQVALLMQAMTGVVPQLVDVALATSAEPAIAGHADPRLRGNTEPVLVFEYIPGTPLSDVELGDEDLLVLIRGLCEVLRHLHRPDANGTFRLYVDWKPANIVRHPESGTFTIVDLGAIVPVVNGAIDIDSHVDSTDPFAGPEEYPAQVRGNRGPLNTRLGPPYDLHGVAGVCWYIATRAVEMTLPEKSIGNHTEKLANDVQQGGAAYPVLKLPARPGELPDFRAIIEKGLQPDPADRYQTAGEMAAAATEALGRLSKLVPEAVLDVAAEPAPRPNGTCDAKITCLLPLDPFCEAVEIERMARAGTRREDDPWVLATVSLKGHPPGTPFTFVDNRLMHDWTHTHYWVRTVGFNGQKSEPQACEAYALAEPENVTVTRHERALELRWEIPEVVTRNNGHILVERLVRGGKSVPVPVTQADRCTDAGLDPGADYEYRVYSKLDYGASKGKVVGARPWPTLARVQDVTPVPDDRKVRLRWLMTPGAVSEIAFLRSQVPLAPDEIARAAKRTGFRPVPFRLDAQFRAVAVADGSATLEPAPGGLLQGEWVDTTAVPGVTYYYTPVQRYKDDHGGWEKPLPAVQGVAFAEATRFEADELPAAVRLSWTVPEHGQRVRLTRLAPTPASWEFEPDQTVWLDRGLPAGPSSYELKLCFGSGGVWSRGLNLTRTPLADWPQLPAAAPRPAPPRVRACPEPGGLEVLLDAPPGCRGVLVTLPERDRSQFVEAGGASWRFDALAPGPCAAVARTLGADGRLSVPVRVESFVPAATLPTGEALP